MTFMHVEEDQVDCCHDCLSEELSQQFIDGGYTQIECEGRFYQTEVVLGIVYLGEDVTDGL